MRNKPVHITLKILCLLFAAFVYSQKSELTIIDSLVEAKEVSLAFDQFGEIDTTKLNSNDLARYYMLLGRNLLLDNQQNKGYENYLRAKLKYLKLDSLERVAEINLQIVQLLNATQYSKLDYKPFLDEYLIYAESQNSPSLLSKAYMQIGKCFINSEPSKTIVYFKKAVEENYKTTDSLMNAKINHNIGVLYAEHTPHLDSALYHYDLALKEYLKQNLTDYISYIYNNKATVYKKQEDFEKAIQNYLKADSLPIKEYRKNNKKLLYGFLSDAYEKNKDYENATKYLKLHLAYKDSLGEDEQNTAMLDIQTKYDVEKKENENLKLKQNKLWLVSALVGLGLVLIVGFFAYKNQVAKKKLAESDKEIEQQRVEKLLKEQELNGIDAMIVGQEKERQRIANDLHDNLGSLLATLKLHFQNLKIKKNRLKEEEDAILEKTDNLIDEAYQKVRTIAHARNAGLKAKEGLLPAVKNFAAKVSLVNKLVINVEDHGLDERLENSLEITLFRIIQELVTNVVKHANATESIIHLTLHDEMINVMVEDNGTGFEIKEISKKDGMGLYSIQKRIENLGGKVTIDSIQNEGTSIIIDIPLS